ncbi:hypothetical protein C8R44DRAFT_863420 [Mycena epipterygia]|nr:hypothetical protein C8R44DRAFT_863420 [Mycena epipterygia]
MSVTQRAYTGDGSPKSGALEGYFSEQQSGLSQSSSTAQSMQRQESYSSSMSTSRSEVKQSSGSYEYRSISRLTLADCQLELKLSILTIKAKSGGFEFKTITVNLDEHVGNHYGQLVWGDRKFSESCKDLRLDGTILLAMCRCENGEFIEARLDLNEYFIYATTRRCFEPVVPDAAFTEMMSSAGWMNVAVITQPDMRGFLTNPAFQGAIRAVAQRAVEEVMHEMREQMTLAVEKAVTMVSAKSEEYVQWEMETLTKKATMTTASTAAYSGLGNLTVMSHEQRHAYNTFAPHLSLPHFSEMIRRHTHHSGHIAAGLGSEAILTGTATNSGNGLITAAVVPEATPKGTPSNPGNGQIAAAPVRAATPKGTPSNTGTGQIAATPARAATPKGTPSTPKK